MEPKPQEGAPYNLPPELSERGFELTQAVQVSEIKRDDPLVQSIAGKTWRIMGFVPKQQEVLLKIKGGVETTLVSVPNFLEYFQRVPEPTPEPSEPENPLEELLK